MSMRSRVSFLVGGLLLLSLLVPITLTANAVSAQNLDQEANPKPAVDLAAAGQKQAYIPVVLSNENFSSLNKRKTKTPTPAPTKPVATSVAPTATRVAPTATSVAPTATRIPPTATLPGPTATPVTTVSHFNTLPPGSSLPSDAQCAALVRARPENKGMNVIPNATLGNQRLAGDFFGGSDPLANSYIAPRVTGNYTGTTDMILQWVACKWGIDEDIVRAQAVKESNWHQNSLGDWTTDASRCAPGHGLGVDGKAGQCPQSWGILQVKYIYYASSWPGISTSTAFAADTAYGVWRACYEGYETWLGPKYTAGDLWGCVGRWYAGKWYNQPAADYIAQVQDDLNTRSWETANFQEP